jgi:hypothetical protein
LREPEAGDFARPVPPGLGKNCRCFYAALTLPADSRAMRIDPKPPTALGAGALQRRPAAGRGFILGGESAVAKTSRTGASAPLATVDALLALQGEGDVGERRRRSLKRGHDLLDRLDGLKVALLSGRVATADLQRLTAKLAERRDITDDPRLDDLLSHIELRAKVELAKLGIA